MESKIFKAFVIGPMFREGEDENGIQYADQILNSVHALNLIGAELETQHGIRLEVDAPDRRVRDIQHIPEFALGEIDRCDFAVADISARSPSVMYEIAVLHSLGTPTLLLDRKPASIEDAVYYLKDLTIREVESFSVENIRAELEKPVRALTGVETSVGQDYALNKITEYYRGMPLVDVRAITGIATSYYSNFLRHVLNPLGPIASDHTLDKLIILTPPFIMDNYGATVKSRMRDEIGDRIRMFEFQSAFNRPSRADRIENTVVDYPTPIDSLHLSPQFERTSDRLTKVDKDGSGAAEFSRYQERMISTFCDVVTNLCVNGQAVMAPEFVPLETFFARFGADGEAV